MAKETSTSPAVGRALDVLSHLAQHTGTVTAAALCRDLGLPRSSTYHLLTVLADRGFVVYVPEARGYALGAAAFRLSSAFELHEELERFARPIMRRLAAELGLVVHLGILRGTNTYYLLKEFPRGIEGMPSLVTAVGVLLPAHLTANGRAILAQLDEANVRALFTRPGDFVSRTGRGPRGIGDLLAALAEDRTRGWSEEVEMVSPGLRSAGAAVFDLHGLAIAALSCTWRSRVAGRDPGVVAAALVGGAAELSRRLQGRPAG
jgi:IclR family acetate operon transcriptional repressor